MSEQNWDLTFEEGNTGKGHWCSTTGIYSTLEPWIGVYVPLYEPEGGPLPRPQRFTSAESVEDTLRGLSIAFVRTDG